MKLKPLVLLLAASVLASGCSQTTKTKLDASVTGFKMGLRLDASKALE